ncbi:unnamed protein product, partial [Mesorhabditis belari]|uniref:Uncharacterized protein n=1 Tax=Mesorhabditis belari TaxID=2138241 RepID=A0AAF3F5N6_9BILA
MLVELCAAHKQQMKSLRGAVSEVQNVHSAFKTELKTKQREFKEAAFENHDLSQPAMTKLLLITRVQETKIEEAFEECLGSSRLIKIRVAFTDFAKQLARRGTENILKQAMAEATNLVNQRWKEHLTRKAEKSRFAEYLTLLLQDSAESTADCTA